MKIEIFVKEPDVGEDTVRLGLVRKGNAVYLAAVDVLGEPVRFGYLLRFRENGRVDKCIGINPALGFRLDNQGRMHIEG